MHREKAKLLHLHSGSTKCYMKVLIIMCLKLYARFKVIHVKNRWFVAQYEIVALSPNLKQCISGF